MLDKKTWLELQKYVEAHLELGVSNNMPLYSKDIILKEVSEYEIEEFIKKKRKPEFKQVLFTYIDKAGLTDPEVYNKIGMDRKHFSKIRTTQNYRPGKNTILALAIGLELTTNETVDLLSAAGYSFSDSDITDLVVQYCLEKNIYDIDDVNVALESYKLNPLLG
ncbi:hypothetical protein VBD025_00675 [Virgibacillus flavescens]|uniref:hypothetical protein n=1 Tax=Virgibacillus flavescens TaxID=1611422 RepID=UPI003D352DB9